MNISFAGKRALLLLLLGVVMAGFCGCASTEESENASVKPWAAPKSWEGGFPAGLMEGR